MTFLHRQLLLANTDEMRTGTVLWLLCWKSDTWKRRHIFRACSNKCLHKMWCLVLDSQFIP